MLCPVIAEVQKNGTVFQGLRANSKYSLREYPIFPSTYCIYCETSGKGLRPYIPAHFYKEIDHVVHDIAHPDNESVSHAKVFLAVHEHGH